MSDRELRTKINIRFFKFFICLFNKTFILNHKIFIMNSPEPSESANPNPKYHLLPFYILVLTFVFRLFYCVKMGPKHLKCVTLLNMLRYASMNFPSLHSLSIWILTIYSVCSLLIHNSTFAVISKHNLHICLTSPSLFPIKAMSSEICQEICTWIF